MPGDFGKLQFVIPIFKLFDDRFRLGAVVGRHSRVYIVVINAAFVKAHGEKWEKNMRVRWKQPNRIGCRSKVRSTSDVAYVKRAGETSFPVKEVSFVPSFLSRRIRHVLVFKALVEWNEPVSLNAVVTVE